MLTREQERALERLEWPRQSIAVTDRTIDGDLVDADVLLTFPDQSTLIMDRWGDTHPLVRPTRRW